MAKEKEEVYRGFIFKKSYLDAIAEADEEDKLELFHAICYFGIYGEVIKAYNPLINGALELIKEDICANRLHGE